MRLLIDAASALQGPSRGRGIGRYGMGLVKGLIRTAGEDKVVLAFDGRHRESASRLVTQFKISDPQVESVKYFTPPGVQYTDEVARWKRRSGEEIRDEVLEAYGCDYILNLSLFDGFEDEFITSTGSGSNGCRSASIVYDMIPANNPILYLENDAKHSWYHEKLNHLIKSDVIFSISNSTTKDLLKYSNCNPNKICTIFSGAEKRTTSDGLLSTKDLANKYKIAKPFFLYVAPLEPRKNFSMLFSAFREFIKLQGHNYQLVCVTADASRKPFFELCRLHGVPLESVRMTGSIPDSELNALYRDCLAFVFPSLSEGFGLPVLEAMHFDVPVICSNTSSLPEVVGLPDATFSPEDSRDICRVMVRVVSDPNFRSRLIENGRIQREKFTWERSATLVWSALRRGVLPKTTVRPIVTEELLYSRIKSRLNELAGQLGSPTEAHFREVANCLAENIATWRTWRNSTALAQTQSWRIEGPYDSTYSLALLNREIGRALREQGVPVQLFSTEGHGDYLPNAEFLREHHPDIASISLDLSPAKTISPVGAFSIVSRNLYPPRVTEMRGDFNLLHSYAWEEAQYPSAWVDRFNLHLDGLTCLSQHVLTIMENNGVAVPLSVSGCGVDHWERIVPADAYSVPGRAFRFLHVSSCLPRKGADALVEAFGRAFRKNDDVSLTIKTFLNEHNHIPALVQSLVAQDPDFPDVHVIIGDITDGELKRLYLDSQCLVAPSRAEGFGLPIAEAMLCGIPVITVRWGGQLDFCDDKTAYLVNFRFEPARTHFNLPGSVWAEPDIDNLAATMRTVFETPDDALADKTRLAREKVLANHTWAKVAENLTNAVEHWRKLPAPEPIHIGWMSTWGTPCGISTYSEHILRYIDENITVFGARNDVLIKADEPNVIRPWQKEPGGTAGNIAEKLSELNIDLFFMQFNYFFNCNELINLINEIKSANKSIIIEFHAVRSDSYFNHIKTALSRVDKIIVHSVRDLNILKDLNLVENVMLVPHGLLRGKQTQFVRPADRGQPFTLGTFGFCLPHKGLAEIVDMIGTYKAQGINIRLKMLNALHTAQESEEFAKHLIAKIAEANLGDRITLNTDFLSDADTLNALNECDLITFNYKETGESASGAVRIAIASGRPVLVNDCPIFDDVASAVFRIPQSPPEDMAVEVLELLGQIRDGDPRVLQKQEDNIAWRIAHDYETIAAKIWGVAKAVANRKYWRPPCSMPLG